MEIHKMLVVSTGHLSEACAETLYHDRDSMYSSFGYIRYTGKDAEPLGDIYPELKTILDYARETLDCSYVYFDRDGETLEQFPIFDW